VYTALQGLSHQNQARFQALWVNCIQPLVQTAPPRRRRDAEVRELDGAVAVDEDVARLDVAVDVAVA
jgi:hypothetical protein